MTTVHEPAGRLSELDLASRQLDAITRFTLSQRIAQEAAATAARSRELRMDSERALEVMRREHDAVISRAHEQLRRSGEVLRRTGRRRIVLAHRSEWFVDKVSDVLQAAGWDVVARLDNGADAVGLAVAEQPELVLVEDTLAMLPGEQVVREVRQFCPHTLVAAQVPYSDRVGALLEAGAVEVFTRQVPPADVASRLLELATA